MQARICILIIFISLSFFSSFVFAEEGYVGEDLWNDIYKRIDEGIYKLKKQLVENRLVGSTQFLNDKIGKICSIKEGTKILCFREWIDFTTSELDEISGGSLGAIYIHIDPKNTWMDVEKAVRIRGLIMEHYQELLSNVAYEQKKLQSVGSIGLFSDGNKDNSSYDLMVDLQNIHNVIFARDIPYNGTDNMGASSVANILSNVYPHPLLPLDSLILSPSVDPGVSLIPPTTSSWLTLSWFLENCPKCTDLSQVPNNLDTGFLRDVQSQLLVGTNPNSSIAFSDNGMLPEHWANVAQENGVWGSTGWAGGGSDTFPCSGKDFFCIIVSMTDYAQNILWGGKSATIEKILDENLKIVNTFAPSSFVQAKMTKMFFGLSLKNLDLPSLLHIGVIVSRLPPPILNLKSKTEGNNVVAWNGAWASGGTEEDNEFNKIMVCTFEEWGLDFKRQNSLEKNNESRAIHNLTYQTTDIMNEKLDTSQTPQKSGCIRVKEMDLKKSYGDSFNDDLFELYDFTLAFTKSIKSVTDVIKAMYAIPQK